MTAQQGKARCSCFKSIYLLVLSAIILLPVTVRAESFYLKQTAELLNSGKAVIQKYSQRSADFSMNRNGDVVMRCLNMSFTVTHNYLNESPDLRELMQRVRVLLTPNHDGINVKVGFAF